MTALKRNSARLFYASSESCADLFYFGRFFCPDPFLAFECKGKRYALLNRLEYDRAAANSKFDEILSLEQLQAEAKSLFPQNRIGPVECIRYLARHYGITSFVIPYNFPAGIALELKKYRLKVELGPVPFFPDRQYKSDSEVKAIRKANRASAAGIAAAERMLERSKIKKGILHEGGKVLTSERLRRAVEIACLECDAVPSHTIVAGGEQACDPHCTGSGALRANELIIVDVFPRLVENGYHGDMTRTFLKGKASEPQKQLVKAVRKAQKCAISLLKHNVSGNEVHQSVLDVFESKGYKTEERNGRNCGFFHGTGHGLGLDIHEAPRVSMNAGALESGMVVTIEPGLYYPGLGACRIEDVFAITQDGADKLSKYHYKWIIK